MNEMKVTFLVTDHNILFLGVFSILDLDLAKFDELNYFI